MAIGSINRREFLARAGVGALALGAAATASTGAAPKARPNVLFIAIDDLNDWISCLGGHPDVKTPCLDALAGRGVLFTKAYCAAPACNPSRAALMTGIRPSTSGIYDNAQPWRQSPLLREAVTLPQHFMAQGYSVTGSGKIYHGAFPDPPSWQEYWPSQLTNKPDDPEPKTASPGSQGHFDWGPLDVPDTQMGDSQVADWVINKLEQDPGKPFFLACGFYKPHLPWHVPRKYFDRYPLDTLTLPKVNDKDLDDVPPMGRRIAKPEGDHARVLRFDAWRAAVQGYLASISFVDNCVGRVMEALDRSPHRDNTVVVLWSDHGWHLGEKLHWRKFALWEEATHNVLMVLAPGVTRPGGRCDAPVNLIDIYPTLIDLCGLGTKEELEGVSLRPLLENPSAPWDRPALTTFGRNNHSIRSARWRYIRYSDNTEELYDHSVDELEWTNLAADPQYDAVKTDLARWIPEVNVEACPRNKESTRPQ